MKQIISPLKPGDQGPDVTNLQAALLLLIDRGSIQLSAQEREFFNGLLRQEQQDQTYKDGTARSVAIFQAQRQQPSTGEVDERTADALNQVLRELGALGTAAEQQRVVGGQVRREGGLPLADVPVRAFHVGEAGSLRLGVDTTDPEGGYTIAYTMPPGLSAIQLRVVAYQDNKAVADSGLLPNAQPLQFVNLTVSGGQGEGEPQFRVTGRVFSPASAGVGGLLVHIADKGVGGDFLLTETQTDADGAYEAAFAAKLLANPQFVADEAYTILAGAHFPPPLPFHQPLEALRRYFDRFEAPLPRVMEALRKDDSLERAGDEAYGWRDILMEALKLSRAEYALLSERVLENGNTDVMGTVKKLYGFDPATADQDVRRTLSHAKSFSRRVEISYEELIEVLKTRFVNPGSPLIPRLERLGVSFDTLKKFKDGTITDEQFEEALAPQLDASLYGGDIKAWAKANATTILNLITLTNPNARLSRRLIELGVPLEKLKALKEGAITDDEFEAELPEGLDEPLFGGDVAQWVRDHFTPAGDDCSFEALEFRYADPDKVAEPLRDIEFIRLLRFIRLWKKLGWAISDTDKAMAALYPADQLPGESDDEAASLQKLDSGFLVLLPRLGVLRQVMQALKLKPPSDLPSVLALFAAIDTHGEPSLYRRMFLRPALLKQDPAFADDGAGNVLNDDDEKLTAHAVTLRAAFALTAEELDLITAALGVDADTPLTLEHISAIFRRGWLARALKLSVREFLLLVEFTGLDPFTGIDSFAEEDPARPPILRLIEHLHDLRATSLRPAQALYLIWNQDVSGKSAPEEEEILDFARVLRASLAAIESEFARADDPDGQIARARMALVYGSQATDLFFGLLNHTLVSEVGYDHDQAALEDPILQAAPGRIAYDDFRKRLSFTGLMTEAVRDALKAATGATDGLKTAVEELFSQNNQVLGPFFARYPELRPLYEAFVFFGALESTVPYVHPEESLSDTVLNVAPGRLIYDHEGNELSFKGVLTETIRDALKAVPGGSVQFRAAVDNLFAVNQTAIEDFFADHPALAPHQEDQEAYLRANDALEQRRSVLLASFLPELKRRRKRQQAAQAMSAVGKTEVEFARAVLDATPEFTAPAFDPRPEPVYVLHAAGDPGRPALDDLAVAEAPGLSAQFFFHATASETDPVDLHREAEAHLAYAPGSNPLPENTSSPGSPISGVWRGYLEAPEDDFYNLLIETEAGATVALTLKGNPVSLNQDGNLWSNSEPLELRAGTLYPITLTVESVQAELTVRWETHGRGREVIPARFLYPATGLDVLRQVYVRFLKAASLAAALELAADGFAYLAAHPHYRIDAQGWLNHLAVTGSPDLQTSAALLTALGALLDFARLKAALGDEDGRLLAVLQDPAAAAQEPEGPLFSLTRWDPASLDALLGHFGKTRDDLADLALFRRVYGAFAWVRQMGVPAAVLIAAATNEPEADTVRALQSALRARYKESDWLNVLKPINDEMRALQRDALVAHILQGMRSDPATAHIDTPEKLFEFFLMDVQMEPCMQTSRIRHALSSVQLFIERGLMNLEPRVSPAVIPAEQWAWMSRYRVWEANRKVFLFPENWLEPELRDDQSPFFKETMSELLQSDITEDRAAVALLNYLARLDEVAKLEPCGIYCEEDDPGTEARDEVVHVVARTAGAHHKYYYRRREYGSWTPWEQIRLDIEDNPVIPVVWRGRLLLFWLRILKQTPVDPDAMPTSSSGGGLASTSLKTITQEAKQGAQQSTKVLIQAVLCWSEYYNGKWQPVRTSDVDTPLLLGVFSPGGAGAFDRSALRLRAFEGLDGEAHKPLVIQVIGFERSGFLHILDRQVTFTLFNTHSLPVGRSETTFDQQILQDTTRAVALRLVSASGPRSRFLNTQGDTLAITYREESGIVAPGITPPRDLQRPVLQKQRDGGTDSTVEPRHELRNPWDAPFFYGDSRHLFYVTTAESVVTFLEWGGYVPGTLLEKPARELPPLVQHEPPPPTRRVPVLDTDGSSAAFGAVDPAAMRRFVTEDAYIRRGIGTSGTVRFGEVEIGPAGGLSNGIHRR